MFAVFEISTPFQIRPGFSRCAGRTTFRVWWLWFALSVHPMRLDEMIYLANTRAAKWEYPWDAE